MNWFGLWFTCCLPILLIVGLAWLDYYDTKRRARK